jgi:Ser-tRNA(Ala) deacylase AlaX
VVINIFTYYRTPEAVQESYCKNKSTYESRVDFEYRAEVQHQETCNRLENQILGKVTGTETDSLAPTQFVITVVNFVSHKNVFID